MYLLELNKKIRKEGGENMKTAISLKIFFKSASHWIEHASPSRQKVNFTAGFFCLSFLTCRTKQLEQGTH